METAIRFQGTPGPGRRFLYVDVAGKSFKLCELTKEDRSRVQYDTLYSHTRVPPFRAFDWSPTNESLVVVGQSSGEATLLKLNNDSQGSLSFRTGKERFCNAVALSSQNLLAAGLDKVRTDFCLNIWDINQRVAAAGGRSFGTSKLQVDPLHKLASSESITSVKFFRDNPQTVVAGVRGQFVRLYDLREPSNSGSLQFATRCVSNLAIDGQDENYFASCYPINDPEICVWDRRMMNHVNSSYGGFSNPNDTRSPEISLDLKMAIDIPGQIWSLRFSKTQRGCLGVLSSTGQCRIYNIAKDFPSNSEKLDQSEKAEPEWEDKHPQKIFLRSTQDLEQAYYNKSQSQEETNRIVSFDFMTDRTTFQQPRLITLTGKGDVRIISTEPPPQPAAFSSLGSFYQGATEVKPSAAHVADDTTIAQKINNVRRRNDRGSQQTPVATASSFANQARVADIGFSKLDAFLPDVLFLTSTARMRCQGGYFFNPVINQDVVSDSPWLQTFWSWVEHASVISKSAGMIQDNLDLSCLGIHAIWMEEIDTSTREVGSRINSIPKILENLAKHRSKNLEKMCDTLYPSYRSLCLYISDLAWSQQDITTLVDKLIHEKELTKAAALAIFASEKQLAYKALRAPAASQNHKMLAIAIAGAAQRNSLSISGRDSGALSTNEVQSDGDAEWTDTIASLTEELTDPFARAILVHVRTSDWEAVVAEESLPLKYRVYVALMHLSDKALTDYLRDTTQKAIDTGDIEGVVLTGTGTKEALKLMINYVARFDDLQTAVLGLGSAGAVLKYVSEPRLLRRYDSWRQTYRHMLNSWGLKFDRVRFDIQLQKMAVGVSGQRKIEVARPQVALVCGHCTQPLAQSDQVGSNGKETIESARETAKNPLTSEKAAAIGTVCPKCGRHLPRCGVCDLWLGVPDPSFLPWYGKPKVDDEAVAADLSASLRSAGSVRTAIGPLPTRGVSLASVRSPLSQPPATGTSLGATIPGPRKESQETSASLAASAFTAATPKPSWEEMMRRFTVFCTKCSHGFHAVHAREWFEGFGGRTGHKVCPVATCSCHCGVGT